MKEIDPNKIKALGKIQEHSKLLDDGTPFVTKEKSKIIYNKFKRKQNE
jgi:hypothetical protein